MAGRRPNGHDARGGEPDEAALGVRSEISGSVLGPSVQARDIHGGIHLHSQNVRSLPTPHQLPGPPANFTGRHADLNTLNRACERGEVSGSRVLVVITGAAGVGKTALVLRWLSGLQSRFPDGQLYADLRGYSQVAPVQTSEVLGQFLRSLGVDPAEIPIELAERAALLRSVTADRSLIILLDDAFSAAQVRPLLPSSAKSLVAITSRTRLAGLVAEGAIVHQVGPLRPEAALELFTRIVGDDRVARELPAARMVVRLCAHVPLAVCVAAARLACHPRRRVSEMVDSLSHEQDRLTGLAVEGDLAVHTALDHSYQHLPEKVAHLYRSLGLLFVSWISAGIASAAIKSSAAETERLLDTLVETNLIEEVGRQRYRFHDLVRLHAWRRAELEESSEARTAAARRVLDYFLARTTSAEALLTPSHRRLARDYASEPPQTSFTKEPAALAWLDEQRDNLMAGVRYAAEHGLPATTWQLVDAMWPLFLRRRYYEDWIEAHELGLRGARMCDDRAAEARMLTFGGSGYLHVGRLDDATNCYELSLAIARDSGDRRQEAQAINSIGHICLRSGRLADAQRHYTQALQLRRAIGYRRGAALSRYGLGEVALASGQFADAIRHLTTAHEGLSAEGDPYDATRALALLGRAHAHIGRFDVATGYLQRACEEFDRLGSPHWAARSLEMLGETAEEAGDLEAARARYRESLAIYEAQSSRDAERLRGRLRNLPPSV